MAQTAELKTFDHTGETIRARDVAFWYIVDAGEDEEEEGLYISLSSTADLNEQVANIGSGIVIKSRDLAEIGYYRLTDALDEEALLALGYVKAFKGAHE